MAHQPTPLDVLLVMQVPSLCDRTEDRGVFFSNAAHSTLFLMNLIVESTDCSDSTNSPQLPNRSVEDIK